ncbi:MAG: thiamine pyrophosphate-dependent enzyme, partial [Terriglobales bacterium]
TVFEKLVRLLHVPVGLTWLAMDLLDDEDPLFVGRPGTLASRAANFALQNADFVLVIGTRLDPPLMGWDPKQFARGAYKTVVDIDPAELRKLEGAIDNPICADARGFIEVMLKQASSNSSQQKDRTSWIARCQDWKARYPIVLPEHRAPGLVSLYNLAEVIGQEVGPNDRLVSGSSGSGIETFLLAYRARKGRRVYHTAGLGAMGYGIAASIGVCLGSGGKKTICVDGDGGLQLNIQELATIAHLKLPIKLFVLNNRGYASIRATQQNFFGGPNIGCNSETGVTIPDYRKVARAYGLKTAVIEDQSDLPSAVRRVLRGRGAVVCDVNIIPEEARAPRVTSIQRADGSFVSKPLEDLWPFLEREEFARNMIVEALKE